MTTRKYESPLGGDIGTSKANKGRGWKGLKGQMALALAVSLWIAGMGSASAGSVSRVYVDVDNNNAVYIDTGALDTVTPSIGPTTSLTVTGDWNALGEWYINGGRSYLGTVNGYKLVLDNAKAYSVFGGWSNATGGNVEYNILTIKNNSYVEQELKGGSSDKGYAKYNQVEIVNSTTDCGVYGGFTASGGGDASNNTVILTNSTVNGSVYGGWVNLTNPHKAIDNNIKMMDATVTGDVKGGDGGTGGGDRITGNTLYLSGANTVDGTVGNFATVKLADTLKWNTVKPVITAGSFDNYGTFDITEATALANQVAPGTMTLLSSGTDNNFFTLKLAYNAATQTVPVTLDGTTTSQLLKSVAQTSEDKGVALGYTLTHTVSLDPANSYKNVFYTIANQVNTVSFGEMTWGTGRDASAAGYDYTGATVEASGLTFKNPETISAGTTTLFTANETLADMAATENPIAYQNRLIASGVTMDGKILGSYASSGGNLTYTATANQATKLTFGNVEWKDSGALMNRPSNITFAGAAVDTSNINFTNIKELEANKTMTLVSDFGNSVGAITGTKYKVGSTLEGTGKASLSGNDLIFTAETGTSQEQTHNTVMGAEVGMAALSAGNDFVGAATEGLAMAGNTGSDGLATYANLGGGSMNVETGSHVKTHTWNAILAIGHKNEKKLSTTEYGAFFEYGTGNYSTFNGDERGDGSTRYTGGGILGKWQKNNGFYVEGSLRAGSIHDDANNVLRDVNGNPYSYTTDATYWGAHIGVGREIKLNKTAVLDLYAKYFYNHRGSVSFDAGGHYDLGAVESSVLRVGTRYTVKQNDNINYYGGLAVEHEFCGRASGFADGVAIRGADISGTSVRGEIGATFRPGEKSNVTLDLNLSGFAGKKQGFTGGLSAVFHI